MACFVFERKVESIPALDSRGVPVPGCTIISEGFGVWYVVVQYEIIMVERSDDVRFSLRSIDEIIAS